MLTPNFVQEVGTSLCNVGLFDEDDGALYCESLNSALEYCENELLKAFYHQQLSEPERESAPSFLGRRSSFVVTIVILIAPQKSLSTIQPFPRRSCIARRAGIISIKSLPTPWRTPPHLPNGKIITSLSN